MMMSHSRWQNADRRRGARARLRLRLAIVYPQRDGRATQPIYHGTTDDLGMSGLSMVTEDNVFYEGEVTVLLALPPVHGWAPQKIVEATAIMTYAIHSSKLHAFKIGMSFLEFKLDGRELLEAALRRAEVEAEGGGARRRGTRSRTGRSGDSRPPGC